MNRAWDYIGYLHHLWRENMELKPLNTNHTMDGDESLCTDKDLRLNNTPLYVPGEKYDRDKWRLPLWRLDPYLFKSVMSHDRWGLGDGSPDLV
jgi:hypothetical protein